jgi:Fe(3+) dicitrate transport protein
MNGVITYYTENAIPNSIKHKFPLFGLSAQYDFAPGMNLYGGFSQSYRPVIFKDIIPASIFEVSDKNLKDAYGYNAELGFRGKWKSLKWDVTTFQLQYNNRLGTLAQTDQAGNLIIYRTNIGNARTRGVEFFLQDDIFQGYKSSLSVFTSTSYMNAVYKDAIIKSDNKNVNIDGNKVESVLNGFPEMVLLTNILRQFFPCYIVIPLKVLPMHSMQLFLLQAALQD